MDFRRRMTIAVIAIAATGAGAVSGAAAKLDSEVGSRSLGDELLPQLGNGGYDVEHYRIALDYDPAANSFDSAKTTIVSTATENLRSEVLIDASWVAVALASIAL